ncbi:hypothetical protein K492DRAFT_237443 [Lichtheimia hyalospora FSU 10163]|nr:hypothetical protein K492DRAFT_237443 [Lichtheimia hyalospora FSU 10163]
MALSRSFTMSTGWSWSLLICITPTLAPCFDRECFTGNLTDVNLSSLFGSSSSLPARHSLSTQSSIRAAPTEPSLSSSSNVATVVTPTSSASLDQTAVPSSSSSTSTNDGLGTGALVGIIVGAAVVVIGGLALVIVLVRRKKRQGKKFNPGRGITPSMVISTRSSYNNYDPGNAAPMVIEAPRLHPPTPSPPPPPSPSPAIQGVKQYNHPSPTYLAPPTPAAISSRHHQKQPNSTSPIYHSTMASSSTSSPDRRLSKYNYLAQAFSQMRRPDSQVSTYPTIVHDDEDEPLSPTSNTHTNRRTARYHYI